MGRRHLFAVLASAAVTAGCSGSPASPSPGSTQATEAAVMSAMTQAMRQLSIVAPTGGGAPHTFTMPCPGGGSIVMTFTTTPLQTQTNVFRSSSRMEYQECRNNMVTINGDPYLERTSEHSFPTIGNPTGESSSTHRTTGGMRIDSGGVRGRAQFDCTMTANVRFVNGTPQVSLTSSGTITLEQPLGSTPVVRPCGPA